MVLFEIELERLGQVEGRDAVVGEPLADDGAGHVLQRERRRPVQRQRQRRLEEHAQLGVLVVVDQAQDGARTVHARVVRVETEAVVPLLDARVQRPVVAPEAHAEQVPVVPFIPPIQNISLSPFSVLLNVG